MSNYNMIAFSDEGTVVSEYKPENQNRISFQSEAQLEKEFIDQLAKQGYEYLNINSEEELINNLRVQLEKLNDYTFTDKEWKRFFNDVIANSNSGIVEKTRLIQENHIQNFKTDRGDTINIRLIDKKNIHKNSLQVLNQYTQESGNYENRYDVTILVNGLPLVHTELKRRGINIKEAFNQIDRYQRDSFWSGSGLFEFIQIFVISNGTHTKYYSNTTRDYSIKERKNNNKRHRKTSNSFEFTSFWSDSKNQLIPDLIDFTKTFFARHTLLNLLTKYCVFTTENQLLVMRPYQITATERIINRIRLAANYKKEGTLEAGGYIWHTTGSGKTLTSFKTSQLATELEEIDKVLFVVDRRDLDSQTIKEYEKFQEGSANGNTSTKVLKKQLEDPEAKIIITTIQKLNQFVKNNKKHPAYTQKIAMIFDECHRSQAGEMRQNILKRFKNYYAFGFTGTPIFADNTGSGKGAFLTTDQLFGDSLHIYTIVNAINDHNVLPFLVDFVDTIRMKKGVDEEAVYAIDSEEALLNPNRLKAIAEYILKNFDIKTKRNKSYLTNDNKRLNGFNSLFAVSSIRAAKAYYNIFKELQKDKTDKLKIATIFSFAANEEDPNKIVNGALPEEDFDLTKLDQSSREFLDSAIDDYNQMFDTNFDTSNSGFQNYYEDVSRRMKNREIDMLIVVDMFLTGFDATTLNTLWVDKNLRMHGLIQAFSRTNRILNSIKTYGNIVSFRNLKEEVDEALRLFGDENAHSIAILEPYEHYYNGYIENGKIIEGYTQVVEKLKTMFSDPHLMNLTDTQKKEFIKLFGKLLRLMNILSAFERFEEEKLLEEGLFQDYMSSYHRIREEFTNDPEKKIISDDLVFELELAQSIQVNIDYILRLIEDYAQSNKKDKNIRAEINRNIDSSLELRSKKELINNFIDSINTNSDIGESWIEFVEKEKDEEIEQIIKEENLKPEEARKFINKSLRDGKLKETGTEIESILRISYFDRNRQEKRKKIIERLRDFFDRFLGLMPF